MSDGEERAQFARDRFADLVSHLRILAADADTQNAWLHPCGWTRAEPCEHDLDHAACKPIDELYQHLGDMWPQWRAYLSPMLTPTIETSLNELLTGFEELHEAAWVTELETLDRREWAGIRGLAIAALKAADSRSSR